MKREAQSTKFKTNYKFRSRNSKHIFGLKFWPLESASDFGFWILDLQRRGRPAFTLLEMVVAFGIFAVVIIMAVGAMLAVSNAQIKAANIQIIQDNLRFSLESMTKEMRTGKNFVLPSVSGCPPACPQINFTRSDGASAGYCRENETLRKMTNTMNCSDTNCSDGACSSDITDPELVIEGLKFYIIGQGSGDGQPRITAALQARSRNVNLATNFKLQTTVVQRERDANK